MRLTESRFVTKEEAKQKCPNGVRLFWSNNEVADYKNEILNRYKNKIVSTVNDIYYGYHNYEQLAFGSANNNVE